MIAIHVNAGNSKMGNPRRAYIVLDGAEIEAVVDEGYYGHGALEHASSRYKDIPVMEIRLDVTPAQYRDLIKLGRELDEREGKNQ